MSKKIKSYQRVFKPLHPLSFISADRTFRIPAKSVKIEKVGEKAFGLSCLPKSWTLPFVVLSDELLSLFKNCKDKKREQLVNRWIQQIMDSASLVGIEIKDPIIVRSSGRTEGLNERGKFYSFKGTLDNIYQPLTDCLNKLSKDKELGKQKIPLIIQKHATSSHAKGHLSNERRCCEENRDWLGQHEDLKTKLTFPFEVHLRNWRKKIKVGEWLKRPLECAITPHISERLKIPAAWAYEQGLRLHFEWVWDGKNIYIVQADRELELIGVDPTTVVRPEVSYISSPKFKCLKEVNKSHAQKFNKIHNVFTYIELGLPTRNLYVLDDQKIIDSLASGETIADLEHDISQLIKGSLVIRMDIETNDLKKRQLLPRTNEVRDLDKALSWLKEMSVDVKNRIQEKGVFIFHNFVPSESSAFAYAEPGGRKVQIETLWGLPEGLYYNSHDKFIVDTKTPKSSELLKDNIEGFDIKKKFYCKRFFVTPNQNGQWVTENLKPKYYWRSSVKRLRWIKEIAFESRRIAEKEGKSLSIMWFVGVKEKYSSSSILPWHHESHDPRVASLEKTHRIKTSFDRSLVIRTSEDIEKLEKEVSINEHSNVRRIRIEPHEDRLLRDKNTLYRIGGLAKKIGAIILLEGGVLSHAYYQLMTTGAIVEVLHPFEDPEEKREFYKLVRDKIPSNIESGGEHVWAQQLTGEKFLKALRIKLIEEAFEVFDAIDQDSIVGEMADVNEIIDGILIKLGLGREMLRKRQRQKLKKAGGFKEGLVLLETKNPLPTKKVSSSTDNLFGLSESNEFNSKVIKNEEELIELGLSIDRWTDLKTHGGDYETILNLKIPLLKDNWVEKFPKISVDSKLGRECKIKITGKRMSSILHIEFSLFQASSQSGISDRQLKLFKDL